MLFRSAILGTLSTSCRGIPSTSRIIITGCLVVVIRKAIRNTLIRAVEPNTFIVSVTITLRIVRNQTCFHTVVVIVIPSTTRISIATRLVRVLLTSTAVRIRTTLNPKFSSIYDDVLSCSTRTWNSERIRASVFSSTCTLFECTLISTHHLNFTCITLKQPGASQLYE